MTSFIWDDSSCPGAVYEHALASQLLSLVTNISRVTLPAESHIKHMFSRIVLHVGLLCRLCEENDKNEISAKLSVSY